MAKKSEENVDLGFELDTTPEVQEFVPMSQLVGEPKRESKLKQRVTSIEDVELVSCLRNDKVIVRYVNKPNMNITNPKHVLYGGMAETAVRTFTVPMLRSGALVNVLTDSEKDFLESYMGLEKNSLSVYLKKDNYWRNFQIRLGKIDTYLDLSVPADFIKYKVLLANKEHICPSLQELNDRKKATYQFVLINEGDEIAQTGKNMSASMEASLELGRILENKQLLKYVVEVLSNRPLSKQSKLDFIQAQAFKEMQANPKLFLGIVKDPLLKTRVLITECIDYGIVRRHNDLLYLTANSQPLADIGDEPTMTTAAKYLNAPKHQEVKLTLEAKLKAMKE